MKAFVVSFAALTVVTFSALVFIVAPPLADAQSVPINSSCSKLSWIREGNIFGLDNQLFVAEDDGRDIIRLSEPGPSALLANSVDGANWMPDGRVVIHDVSCSFVVTDFWIVNAERAMLRVIPSTEIESVAPNVREFAGHGYEGVTVSRPNGNIHGSCNTDCESADLRSASSNDALVWVYPADRFTSMALVVDDGLVVFSTSEFIPVC